jgi:hypothetical protein
VKRDYPGGHFWPLTIILTLWLIQIVWLGWRFAPEGADLARRLIQGQIGAAVRQEQPFFQGLAELEKIIPASTTYVFLDRYEDGKEIQVRYILYPRRQVLLPPHINPSTLFDCLVREQAAYLILRKDMQPLALKFLEPDSHPVFRGVSISGLGTVYRVQHHRLVGGFYD